MTSLSIGEWVVAYFLNLAFVLFNCHMLLYCERVHSPPKVLKQQVCFCCALEKFVREIEI